jgi:hypothetical protein
MTYLFTWYVDGVLYGTGTSDTVPAADTAKHQLWRVEVVATDGAWESGMASDEITIDNTPPTIEYVQISPEAPTAEDTLSCTYSGFFDLDSDTDSSTLAWTVNGVWVSGASTLSGVFVSGDRVSCTVTPHDGEEPGVPVSDTVIIDSSAPTVLRALLSPDPAYETSTMVCTPDGVSDPDGDTSFSFAYRWEVDGVELSGLTASTIGGAYFDKHQDIQCFISASDGSDWGPEAASNIVEVLNTPPIAPEIAIEPAFPEEADILSCLILTESTDVDGDAISYGFSWTVDGVAYTGASSTTWAGDTIPSAATAAGETWVCTVTPNDGEADGPSDSDSVTIEDNCGPLGGGAEDGDVTLTSGESRTLALDAAGVVGENPSGLPSLQVDDSSPFMAGDEVLVLTVSSIASTCGGTTAGYWEVHQVAEIDGDTLQLRAELGYGFSTSAGSVHQVVRIPAFGTLSLGPNSTLSAPGWDGRVGGIMIFRARSVQLASGALIEMDGKGYLGALAGSDAGGGPRGAVLIGGGAGGRGGAECTGAACVGGEGIAGLGGGGGGGSAGGNSTVVSGGSCGGGGGGGMGDGVGGGRGLGAGAGGTGGVYASSAGLPGGGGGGCAAVPQEICPDADGQRILMGAGATAGAAGGCADTGEGGLANGGSSCGAAGSGGGAGGGAIVILTAELHGAVGAAVESGGRSGGTGGIGDSGWRAGLAGGGGGSGGDGAAGGTVMIASELWSTGAELLDSSATGGLGGTGGSGGAGRCTPSGTGAGGSPGGGAGDSWPGCGGGGGGGMEGDSGDLGEVYVFGSWHATASFGYTADPVNIIEFYGGEECYLEL